MKKLIIVITVLLFCISANSQKRRLALVIGNGNYPMSILANPVNDAMEMEILLKSSGFEVTRYTDLDQTAMKRVIDEFGSSLNSAEVGLFFYAGHGVQAKGRNYLIPVDASLKTENDVEYNCVDAGRILAKMEDANTRTNIVILDACRDNPFERSWSRKSTGAGLAFMDAPNGSLIAYSTAPGKTASDGYDRNSPYTSALIKYMSVPNLKIEDFFKLVRVNVREQTNSKQVPWESTSLEGDFYFNLDADYVSSDASVKDIESGIGDKLKKLDNIDPALQRMNSYEENRKQQAAGIRSIAIMPFANYTGDESKAYLASGLQDALITELCQLGSVRVTARTSTMQYANFQKTINEIASELNVEGVIETSLIGLGENIRIQLKLYSAFPAEQMIWSQVYDSDMSDILNLYNQVIKNIADEIQISLTPEQEKKLNKTMKINAQAYEAYLMGRQHFQSVSEKDLIKAREYLEYGIEKEPEWAPLYAGLAQVWLTMAQIGFEPPEVSGPKIFENINKALELDPGFPDLHFTLALIATWVEWDWEKGEKEFKLALEVNPNDAASLVYYGQLHGILQRRDECELLAAKGVSIDPFNPFILSIAGAAYLCINENLKGLELAERALEIKPGDVIANVVLEAAVTELNDYKKAMEAVRATSSEIGLDMKELEELMDKEKYKEAYREHAFIMEKLYNEGKAGMNAIDVAVKFIMVDEIEKGIHYIEKAYEAHEQGLPIIATSINGMEKIQKDPRIIEIIQKMKLPNGKFE